jgi:hypothetical protein
MGTGLCGKGNVTITSISLYQPTPGVKLVRWGIENSNALERTGGGTTLASLGSYTSHTVTQHCGGGSYTNVGLQLGRTAPGTQSILGLRVTYLSHGRRVIAYLAEHDQFREPPAHTP